MNNNYTTNQITQQNSEAEIIKFCDDFLLTLQNKLIESGYEKVKNIKLLKIKLNYKTCGKSWNAEMLTIGMGCCYPKYGSFREMKSFSHDPVIGQIINITFQESIITYLASALAWSVNWQLHGRSVKPHGKEYKEIYRILRSFTNALLSDKAIFGYSKEEKKLVRGKDTYYLVNAHLQIKD